jgi:hypothetical protein
MGMRAVRRSSIDEGFRGLPRHKSLGLPPCRETAGLGAHLKSVYAFAFGAGLLAVEFGVSLLIRLRGEAA